MRFLCVLILSLSYVISFSQEAQINGRVLDNKNQPISFATVILYESSSETSAAEDIFVKGTTSDDQGNFIFEELDIGNYRVVISYIGYNNLDKLVEAKTNFEVRSFVLEEASEDLDEALITVKRPSILKQPGKLIFNVRNTSFSTGSTFDLLKKTPGVIVSPEGIFIKNTRPLIYINGKRVYLTNNEINALLQSTSASLIESVEVITNPTAQYDAESGTVLNIITSKPISIGYKGSVSATYEQAIFPKYRFGTSHFYKNNWLNIYGSYSFSPRKEFKEDDNFTEFFEENQLETKSIRTSQFNRTTHNNAHRANLNADMDLGKDHDLGIGASIFVSPNERFTNFAVSENFNAARVLDSTYTTQSRSNNDLSNLSFNLNHTWKLSDAGAKAKLNANYIVYELDKLQNVNTNFFDAEGDLFRTNSFYTEASQESDIGTVQLDIDLPIGSGELIFGTKFSNINTNSGLDFFRTNMTNQFIPALSDDFEYKENIYAAYASYSQAWGKLDIDLGLRAEQTDVTGDSKKLGIVNTQEYFEFFPNLSAQYQIDDNQNIGLSYSRSISRPRYQSLNPFRYFINEFNFDDGNPNLIPAIDNKYTLSYNPSNSLFFELYYWDTDNPLGELTFQNNEKLTLQNIDVNLINEFQYSFDVIYAKSLTSWFYFQAVTSSFYMENEFFALESDQLTFSNDTFGFYGQVYSGLTLSEKIGLTSDITVLYISNFIYGSYDYKNQLNVSVAFQKSLFDKKGILTVGVDDIFNTNNIPLSSKYYNQNNSYFAQNESRLLRIGFTYNFGNARLLDSNRTNVIDEGERLN